MMQAQADLVFSPGNDNPIFYVPSSTNWEYKNWPSKFPNYAEGFNTSLASTGASSINSLYFNYDVIFDDGIRKILLIYDQIPFTLIGSSIQYIQPHTYWIYNPAIWDAWIPDNAQNGSWASLKTNNLSQSQIQQIIDKYVSQKYDAWKKDQSSFLRDVIPLAVIFATIVITAGSLTSVSSATTPTASDAIPGMSETAGEQATTALSPYIAAPAPVESGIPEYISASTLPAPTAVDTLTALESSATPSLTTSLIDTGKQIYSDIKTGLAIEGKATTLAAVLNPKKPATKQASSIRQITPAQNKTINPFTQFVYDLINLPGEFLKSIGI